MHKVQLNYQIGRHVSPALIRNPLLDLLLAVSQEGSISAAARALGLSYRHVWGELKRWENELGNDLIIWEKGQAARLTEFATQLMWAERQAQARLQPQIEALQADLERAFAVAFDDSAHVLTIYASHDDAVTRLREHATANGRLHLDIRFTGSVDAIRALNQGRCVMAGFHTRLHSSSASRAARTYRPLLKPGAHKIIGFARRVQGLTLAAGNPLGVRTLADLTQPGLRYVNRAIGTGTRVLFDELLDDAGLSGSAVHGYESGEPSHASVAQAVASGAADAGLGIEAAARSRGLDFVPLVEEQYHLVCLKSALVQPAVAQLLQLLHSAQWVETVNSMPGYAARQSGEVLSLKSELPWWSFKPR